ncbi:MAG: DUF1501 domain-containing protein [Rhizobacter sp.]|nr:DUF1501 domain-containing protein [Rhizobacter sp.]
MSTHSATRREFLRQAAVLSGSVGTAGLPLALNLAAMNNAAAQSTGYKAIVCLFLYGGNDSANMVLPTDATSWSSYSSVRSTAPDPIALLAAGTAPNPAAAAASPAALGGVLPIEPNFTVFAENSGRTFALHPSMGEAQALFSQGRLAILANVGTLIAPMTKAEFQANTAAKPRPPKLFSHNDQQSVWQALAPEGARIGWGGRFGDLVAGNNANSSFTNISVSGNAVFMSGQSVFQYQVGSGGAVAIGGLTGNLFGSSAAAASLRSIVTADNQHLFAKEHAAVVKRSIDAQAVFQTAFNGSTVGAPTQYLQPSTRALANNSLATQLQTVARIIGARTNLGMQRQVFFVSMGGFDTHDNQNRGHADLMARLSHALAYFDTTMGAMGMRDSVTLFTGSDFGRTFTSNGDGTDHGWGAHHFVLGGAAVRGKEIHGRFPTVGLNHSDEVGSGSLLPGIAVEQIGSGVGKWFGLSDANLDTVFPNLRNFQRDLGFISA